MDQFQRQRVGVQEQLGDRVRAVELVVVQVDDAAHDAAGRERAVQASVRHVGELCGDEATE